MQKQREKIRERLLQDQPDYPADKANAIFDLLEKFAGYGFKQVPCGGLRRRFLSNGLFEGQLPGRIPILHAHQRHGATPTRSASLSTRLGL